MVNKHKLINWIFEFRYLRFMHTPLYIEYNMCHKLSAAKFLKSECKQVQRAFTFLQKTYIYGVSKMRKFRNFLQKVPSLMNHTGPSDISYSTGYIIYNFWMDAEHLKI